MDTQLQKNISSLSLSIHPEKPWQDIDGDDLSFEVLRTESKLWSLKVWSEYLESIETPCSESLVSDSIYSTGINRITESVFKFAQKHSSREIQKKVRSAVSLLSPRQRNIIELTFWDNLSEREIAQKLKISRSTVKVMKKRSILKIQKIMCDVVVKLEDDNVLLR